MSEESHLLARPPSAHEKALLAAMLSVSVEQVETEFDAWQVQPLSDGGMGSLRLIGPDGEGNREFGETLAEAQYVDRDGVTVLISLNTDKNGKVFELDFWKVDFSPLLAFPEPQELIVRRIGGL